MYQAMYFIPIPYTNGVMVRATRSKPFKSFDAAVRSVIKTGNEGYVKQQGQPRPIWNNLAVN